MARLREMCTELGWANVRTYIQSGNVVFGADAELAALESALHEALSAEFPFEIPVLIRSEERWRELVANNPFRAVGDANHRRVMLALCREVPAAQAVAAIRERSGPEELVEQQGDALWIQYARGMATSTLSHTLLERLTGTSVTTRNWRTVRKLEELLDRGATD